MATFVLDARFLLHISFNGQASPTTTPQRKEIMFKLGATYEDKITGFRGIATGHVRYMTGCNQVLLQPRVGGDGKKIEPEWFDEQRLDDLGVPVVALDNTKTPGFDAPAPKR